MINPAAGYSWHTDRCAGSLQKVDHASPITTPKLVAGMIREAVANAGPNAASNTAELSLSVDMVESAIGIFSNRLRDLACATTGLESPARLVVSGGPGSSSSSAHDPSADPHPAAITT